MQGLWDLQDLYMLAVNNLTEGQACSERGAAHINKAQRALLVALKMLLVQVALTTVVY